MNFASKINENHAILAFTELRFKTQLCDTSYKKQKYLANQMIFFYDWPKNRS
jgi:hypothetical protein